MDMGTGQRCPCISTELDCESLLSVQPSRIRVLSKACPIKIYMYYDKCLVVAKDQLHIADIIKICIYYDKCLVVAKDQLHIADIVLFQKLNKYLLKDEILK